MTGKIIMWIVCFGCAILFFGIGVYANQLKKPMWFYSGVEVDASQITNIRAYNRENGVMWQLYSLWYFAAGLAEIFSSLLALALMLLGCSIGIILLILRYQRIIKKFTVPQNPDLP